MWGGGFGVEEWSGAPVISLYARATATTKKCDLYSSATYICFFFSFIVHLMAGATCTPERLIVRKIR